MTNRGKVSVFQLFVRALSIAAAGALAVSLTAGAAGAAPEGKVKKLVLNLTSQGSGIRVISGDGQKWTQIEDGPMQFAAQVKIEMGAIGKIRIWGIYWGACDGDGCFEGFGTPLLHSHYIPNGADEFNQNFTLKFPASKIPFTTATGIAPTPYGDEAIAECNSKLTQGKGIHETHIFSHTVPLTLGVDTYIGLFDELIPAIGPGGPLPLADIDADTTAWVEVPVTCVGVPVPPSAGTPGKVVAELPPFELLGATLHGHPAEHAGSCPVGIQLFMSATSNLPGPFTARVEAKSGWISQPFNATTNEADPGGTWSRHFQETLTVPIAFPVKPSDGGAKDAAKGIGNVKMNPKQEEPAFPGKGGIPKMGDVKTGYNPGNLHEDSLRLVVKSGDQTVVTDWWTYSVTCDPQKAKVADGAPSGVKQAVFIEQAFLALFPSATKDGAKCGITVSGLIQTNVKNVAVTFRLRNHQGNTTNAQTIQTTHANNIGKFVEYLDFTKSGQGSWVTPGGGWSMPGTGGSQAGPKSGSLQIVVESPAKFEGNVASYNFTCYDPVPVGLQQPPTVKVDPAIPRGPGSVVGKGNNTTALPDRQIVPPPVKPAPTRVTPQPKLVCSGGSVRNDACVCRAGYAPVRTGATSYRCNRIAVLPPPVVTPKPVAPTRVTTPQIACAGGVVRSNRCVCPGGTTLQNGACRAPSAPVRTTAPQRVR